MSDNSDIEWTDSTWNPVRGCVPISPGCKHCYAKTFAERWRDVPWHAYEQGFDPKLAPHMLAAPLHWRRPRDIFVNSMSDLFQEFVANDYIAATFGVMASCPRHTFQVLTKRAERLPEWFAWIEKRERDGRALFPDDPPAWRIGQLLAVKLRELGGVDGQRPGTRATGWDDFDPRREPWPLPNVWLGVSVEDRKYGVPRIDFLRRTPAAVRFLSIEPLLEDLGPLDLTGIGWVIVGGESGLGARPMEIEWVRSIRDQCVAAKVPFFFKQWGGVLKKKRGCELDGRTWDEMPARAVST
jgi:protein gp37